MTQCLVMSVLGERRKNAMEWENDRAVPFKFQYFTPIWWRQFNLRIPPPSCQNNVGQQETGSDVKCKMFANGT